MNYIVAIKLGGLKQYIIAATRCRSERFKAKINDTFQSQH